MTPAGRRNDDLDAVLDLLDLGQSGPGGLDVAFAVTGLVGLAGTAVALGQGGEAAIAFVIVGTVLFGTLLGLAGLAVGRRGQVRALATDALERGLSVHETAVTIGGVPPIRGLRFEWWIGQAERRIEEALNRRVRASHARGQDGLRPGIDDWSQRCDRADQLLAALSELRDAARPGPLRERITGVVREAATVRTDVHRLATVGAATGTDAPAGREAAMRIDELLASLRTAVDATGGSLLAAEQGDGIDAAASLRLTTTALLQAHREVAEQA